MDGWIKLHRKILKSRAWCGTDAAGKVILLTLLLNTSHANTVWRVKRSGADTVLAPGELFISYRAFAKSCGVSFNKVVSEFKRLRSIGFLSCRSSSAGTIVSIVNWDKYQLAETPLETLPQTLGKAENADGGRDTASLPVSLETPLVTLLQSHNKNNILTKNNINKVQGALAPEFVNAIHAYNGAFPNAPLRYEDMQYLQEIAATVSTGWIAMAVSELLAQKREGAVRKPQKYLLGVLKNWLKDGVPYVEKSESALVNDFYEQEGV